MTDRMSTGDTGIERSRAALLERFPYLEATLSAEPAAVPVLDQGVVIDLDLGSARLYGTDGRALAARQLETYFDKPLRFFVTSVRGANVGSPVSAQMLDFMFTECKRLGLAIDDLEVKPHYEGSYLVVLGLGLGYHLEPLIERTAARHIVLVEPYPDFLRQTLATVDWAGLLERLEARGGKLTLALTRRPDRMVDAIQAMFQAEGIPFVDGTYVFSHYPAAEMFEARDRLAETVETLFVSRGYYEDELVMLINTIANLARPHFHLLDTTLKPERPEPVFLIGSGPSIDHTIEHVKRLRDRAVVFSCGTGLKICLAHGIVPDFHTEIENGDWVYDALKRLADQHGADQHGADQPGADRTGLAGITLVATLTVDPRVPDLFDDRILFFRDSVCGTRLFAPAGTEIFGAVPTVANTALRLAMGLGFRNFYLFGIDCGTKSLEKKHSRLAIYNESDQFKRYEDMMEMAYTLPGNFGGTVKSDWVFNFSRLMLERLIWSYGLKAYNCSDGARIAAAVPRVASSVTLPNRPLDPVKLKVKLRAVLRDCPPGALLGAVSFDTLRGETQRFRTDALAMVDAALAEDPDFVAFWKRLAPFCDNALAEYHHVPTVFKGSMLSMPKIGMFFAHRIREAEVRREIYRSFLGRYRMSIDAMADGLLARLAALEQEYAAAIRAAQEAFPPEAAPVLSPDVATLPVAILSPG